MNDPKELGTCSNLFHSGPGGTLHVKAPLCTNWQPCERAAAPLEQSIHDKLKEEIKRLHQLLHDNNIRY